MKQLGLPAAILRESTTQNKIGARFAPNGLRRGSKQIFFSARNVEDRVELINVSLQVRYISRYREFVLKVRK